MLLPLQNRCADQPCWGRVVSGVQTRHPSLAWQTGVEGQKCTLWAVFSPPGSISHPPTPSRRLGLVSPLLPTPHCLATPSRGSYSSPCSGALVTFLRLSTSHLNIFLLPQLLHPFLFAPHPHPQPWVFSPLSTLLHQSVPGLFSESSCSQYSLWTSSRNTWKLVRRADSWAAAESQSFGGRGR